MGHIGLPYRLEFPEQGPAAGCGICAASAVAYHEADLQTKASEVVAAHVCQIQVRPYFLAD
jgi:hypothetical protein